MINLKCIKSNKGITLLTLAITIAIMLILTVTFSVNFTGYVELKHKTDLETDIRNLKEQIDQYYARENHLPVINNYTIPDALMERTNVNDKNKYFVIDLRKINEDLNYGKDFYKVIEKDINTTITQEDNLLDLYIINENTNTIYYPKGISYKGKTYYTINDSFETAEGWNTFYIYNKEQLETLRNRVNEGDSFENTKVILMADIDMQCYEDDSSTWWTPIGTTTGNKPFKGFFEGNNHTISNLYINTNTDNDNPQAFIGYTVNATIKDLNLQGQINVINNENSNKNQNAAGFVGIAKNNIVIENCINRINVKNESQYYDTAGFISIIDATNSSIYNVTISNCKNSGSISGYKSTSACIGKVNAPCNISVTKFTNNGDITSETTEASGCIATVSKKNVTITLKESSNNGKIQGQIASGFLSKTENNTRAEIEVLNCINTGNISANTIAGGIIGNILVAGQIKVKLCTNTADILATSMSASGCIGDITICNGLEISECKNMGSIICTNNNAVGFLSYISGCTGDAIIEKCENLGEISGYELAAGILGRFASMKKTSIKNCQNNQTINCEKTAGGILGKGDSGELIEIENCVNSFSVSSKINSSGGIIGKFVNVQSAKVTNCKNTGSIISEGNSAGGIIASLYTKNRCIIVDSQNIASVQGNSDVGGIVGYADSLNGDDVIYNTFNTGNITSTNNNAGGIIGNTYTNSFIINTFNSGNCTGNYQAAGLIACSVVQKNIIIINAYNTGNMTINGSAGVVGYAGYFTNSAIKNVYNAGNIIGFGNCGIVYIGNTPLDETSSISNAYFLNNVSIGTNLSPDLATPKTEAELKGQEFLDELNTYVSENPTYTVDSNLSINLKQWKMETNAYPSFE